MTARRILVYGSGGHGKVVAEVSRAAGFDVVTFIDDDAARQAATVLGLGVVSWQGALSNTSLHGMPVALGMGDNPARQRCSDRIASAGFEIATLIHPSAVIAPTARIGAGTVVMPLAVVNPDAVVAEGCILNTGCVIEHDCILGKFVHISPNGALGGGVSVGDRAHVGLGAIILPGISIGVDVRVGAGAVVTKAVPDGITVVGAPARPLEKSK